MKKNIVYTLIALGIATSAFYSCERDYTLKSPYATTAGSSYLEIVDAAPHFRSVLNAPDSFNILINGNKITGYTPGSPLILTYGNSFPSASGFGYISFPSGMQQVKVSAGYLNPDSLPITNFTKAFAPDTHYTLMITDSINSTRDSSRILVADNYVTPTSGYFNLRFIHAVWNDTVGKTIDVWSTRTNRAIFTNIKPGAITGFTAFPYNSIYSDTIYVRRHASSAAASYVHDTLATFNTVSFSNQRNYTLFYLGDANVTTGTKARKLATLLHE